MKDISVILDLLVIHVQAAMLASSLEKVSVETVNERINEWKQQAQKDIEFLTSLPPIVQNMDDAKALGTNNN